MAHSENAKAMKTCVLRIRELCDAIDREIDKADGHVISGDAEKLFNFWIGKEYVKEKADKITGTVKVLFTVMNGRKKSG